MALRVPLSPIQPPKPKSYFSTTLVGSRVKTLIKCSFRRHPALGANLAKQADKMVAAMWKRQEAMEKSRELLFGELCRYLSMESGEAKAKWMSMEQDDKCVLATKFISDWGENFHPLSARSVVDLVDEFLDKENGDSHPPSEMLPKLKGFTRSIRRNITNMHEE